MSQKSTTAAVVMAILVSANVAFAPTQARAEQGQDYLDPLFRIGSRLDDLSPYPGPRLTTPSPTYPTRPRRKGREERVADRLWDMGTDHALGRIADAIPATKPLKKAYDAYNVWNGEPIDHLCLEDAYCAAMLEVVAPQETSNLADIERPDTTRARKEKARIDELVTLYNSPIAAPSRGPRTRLQPRIEEPGGFGRAAQQWHEQQVQRKIDRDRRAAFREREGAWGTDEFLADINRRLNDPSTDPAQRRDLSDAAKLLRRTQQSYRDQGILPSPPRESYVAPTPIPVYQPRQAPVVLPPSDRAPQGGGGRGARRAD